ncbi:MAG: DUF3604 domain-containing protein, partial [Candidatus Latescibacteria bacterium]|nr:DUF3604 domain-containing protein [Candidatus Latescibacterota bacterium]
IATSNPVRTTEHPGPHRLYWGDFHGGQIPMAEKITDFFRYARDVAAIDFAGYQRNDHAVSTRDWELQQEAERGFNEPGRFVPIPGFEWSAGTAEGGHHNVYFRRQGQPIRRSSHSGLPPEESDTDTDLPHILDVYACYRNTDVVITPHVGGEHADLTHHDPSLEPALEVVSTHGSFEWFLREALACGYRLGFLGGSDSHTGRPGTDHPGHQARRYAKSGLTAILAEALTVPALLEALVARRCYATTGARMLVEASADGRTVGEEYSTGTAPEITVSVVGTAPLESLTLYRGIRPIYDHPIHDAPPGDRVRVLWEGASRQTSYSGVIWDGLLRLRGGTIASTEELRFDSPRSSSWQNDDGSIGWHAVTCGYQGGLVLDITGGSAPELELAVASSVITGPQYGGHGDRPPRRMSYAPAESLTFHLKLDELKAGPRWFDLGTLDRGITVSLLPETEPPRAAGFTLTDTDLEPGINPYWLRAVQTDMEAAWSSPIFVDYAP